MAILIDLSQVAIANIMTAPETFKGNIEEDLIKHMIINSLRLYKLKFYNKQYGDMVICCDGKRSWRHDVFPFYKASRKENRDKSLLDWNKIFSVINSTKQDLVENFPYKVVEVFNAEGDDVIATICKRVNEKHVIISSDKDFKQLQKLPNVQQYCPRNKDFIVCDNPNQYLQELIILGDKGDGIPNIKSPGNSFVIGKRQSSIYKTDLFEWVKQDYTEYAEDDDMKTNYERNRQLIDFEYIPKDVEDKIMVAYNVKPEGTIKKIMEYLTKNKMRNLLSEIQTF